MRTRRCYALLVTAVLVLLMVACGGEEPFEQRGLSEIETALEGAGLEICETVESPGEVTENAVDEQVLVVALSCGEDDDQAVVELIAWPDEAARDAALGRYEVQTRPYVRNHGVTWALGQFTVDVSGERDDDVVERVAAAMYGLGAS